MFIIYKKEFFILLFLTIFISGCDNILNLFSDPDEAKGPPPRIIKKEGLNITNQKTPKEVLEALDARYRLKPDNRFLMALNEIDGLVSNKEASTTVSKRDCKFINGKWVVTLNNKEIGKLNEIPDFEELYSMLVKYAKSTGVAVKKSKSDLDNIQFPAPGFKSMMELHTLGRQWKKEKNTDVLVKAVYASISTFSGIYDNLDVSDPIAAKAIGLTALAEGVTEFDLTEAKALLAYKLGYDSSAIKLAEKLPENNWVVLLVNNNITGMKNELDTSKDKILHHILYLQTLLDNGKDEDVIKELLELPEDYRESLPALSIKINVSKLPIKYNSSWRLVSNTLFALFNNIGTPLKPKKPEDVSLLDVVSNLDFKESLKSFLGISPGKILPSVQKGLEKINKQEPNPFTDKIYTRSFFKTHILNGIDIIATDLMDRRNSTEAAKKFSDLLGGDTTPLGKEYLRFLNAQIDAAKGKQSLADLITEIKEINVVGPVALVKLYNRAENIAEFNPVFLQAPKELLKKSDTRVSHQFMFAGIFLSGLKDIRMSQILYKNIARISPMRNMPARIWVAALDKNEKLLNDILNDKKISSNSRRYALKKLQELDLITDDKIDKVYNKLINESNTFGVVKSYVKFLIAQSRYQDAYNAFQSWLDYPKREVGNGLADIAAKVIMAEMLQKQNKLDDAWEMVEPLIKSMKGDALVRGALILSEMGKHDEAVKLAEKNFKRYGNSSSISTLARILWQADKNDEAAALLASPARSLTLLDWSFLVGPKFVKAFGLRSNTRAEDAFDKLQKSGVSAQKLNTIPDALNSKRHYKLAFTLNSKLSVKSNDMATLICKNYTYLKNAEGVERAMDWLKKNVPPQQRLMMTQFAYGENLYNIPWELVDDPIGKDDHSTFTWVMRTASYYKVYDLNLEWKKRLQNYYSTHVGTFYLLIGRYLMGMESEEKLWKAVNAADKRTEATYYIGLKHLYNGDALTAVKWFRSTMETGQIHEGETTWAYHILWELADEGLSIEEINKLYKRDR